MFSFVKTRYDNIFFHPSLLLLFLDRGSGIRDKHPGSATMLYVGYVEKHTYLGTKASLKLETRFYIPVKPTNVSVAL
jgi:hypothetical protein